MTEAKSKRGRMLFLSVPLRILRWQLKLLERERRPPKTPEPATRVPTERVPAKQPRRP